MLLVTGPLTLNMKEAVHRAYEATPHPKLVVAVGECACTGGMFRESYAVCGPLSNLFPVDVTIPGCPPPPIDILRGILAALRTKHATSPP
jgi:Ni,Fe-hydrogenase III small subunit